MPARSAPPVTRPALRRPPARHWSTTPGQTGVRGESTAADLRDQHDLAVGLERGLVGVLKDLAVDRDFFFFKQKTAYEVGLGIPAEPLFRSKKRSGARPGRPQPLRGTKGKRKGARLWYVGGQQF